MSVYTLRETDPEVIAATCHFRQGGGPLVEGGKGIAVSNGESSGAWAALVVLGRFPG